MCLKLVALLVLALYLLPTAWLHIRVEEAHTDHVPLAKAALFVTKRYVTTRSNTLIILEKCRHCKKPHQNYHSRILDYFLHNFKAGATFQLFLGQQEDQPWNFNVFLVDSVEAFRDIRFKFPHTLHERQYFFLIILTKPKHHNADNYRTMHEIFLACLNFDVLNAVIMMENRHENIDFYTYVLFGKNCDLKFDIEWINRFQNGRMRFDFLFPLRLTDLYNCSIRVCVHNIPPLMVFKGNKSDITHLKDRSRLRGIDGSILRLVGKALNFSVTAVFATEPSRIGTPQNSSGCFALLAKSEVDVAIGGFSYSHPQRNFFTSSVIYHSSPFIFVVRSGQYFGDIRQLVQPFCYSVWLTMGATLLIALGVITKSIRATTKPALRAFILGNHNPSPFSNLLTILLGNPIIGLPKGTFARFLLMSWMLIALVLRNAYQGKLYDTLRVSKSYTLPQSINELLEREYTMLSTSYYDFYPENRTRLVRQNFIERYHSVNTDTNCKLTTVSLLDNLAYYNKHHWNTSTLTFVNEPIHLFYPVMYFRKNSILKVPFDQKIQQLISAGIPSHIEKRYVTKKFQLMNAGVQRVARISNKMLKGLYLVYGLLMLISLGFFIAEMQSRRFERLKKFFCWVHST